MDKLLSRLMDGDDRHTARYVMMDSVGRLRTGGTACHGGLATWTPDQGTRHLIATAFMQHGYVSAHHRKELSAEDMALVVRYVDYLINRSPFSSAYVSKDAEVCAKQDAILITTDVPSNLMAAACVATRGSWERSSGVCKAFCALVDRGVGEDLSLFLANSASFRASESSPSIKWSRPYEDHHCIEANLFKWQCLDNLMSHRPAKLNPTYRKNNNYRGINLLFLSYKPEQDSYFTAPVKGTILEWIGNNYVVGGKQSAVRTNPFPSPRNFADEEEGKWELFEEACDGMASFVKLKLLPRMEAELGV